MIVRATVLVGLCAVFSACGSSSSTPSTPSPAAAASVSIPVGARTLGTSSYAPNPITISAGATVTWTNNDSIAHTSTSDSGVFDSGTIAAGGKFSFTFQSRGTFPYHCAFHPGMIASVVQ